MKITLEVQTVENGELITVTDHQGISRTHVREDGSYSAKTIRAKLADIVREEYDRWQEAGAEADAKDFQAKMDKRESQRIDAILGTPRANESAAELPL